MKGSIRSQGKGSWEVRLYLGRGPDGRKLYKSHTVEGTKRQAQNELNVLLSKLQKGEYVAPSKMTVAMMQGHLFEDPDAAWNAMMAAAILYALPPIAVFLLLRRYIARGVAVQQGGSGRG